MSFDVRFTGAYSLKARLDRLRDFTKSDRFRALLHGAGEAYVILARRDAPKQTRVLANSLFHRVENFGTPQITLRIGFNDPGSRYAAYVERGASASIRVPRLRRYMHWFTSSSGKTIPQPHGLKGQTGYTSHYARRVRHPGVRPRPFFMKHLPFIRERLLKGVANALNEELGRA